MCLLFAILIYMALQKIEMTFSIIQAVKIAFGEISLKLVQGHIKFSLALIIMSKQKFKYFTIKKQVYFRHYGTYLALR